MKTRHIINTSILALLGLSVCACSSESPFETAGEGILKIETKYRSDITVTTRGEEIAGYTDEELGKKLVVYIENGKGVIRKYLGQSSIPENIYLPVGNYVFEGWTGDSVSASWDKKFFRGYQSNVTVGTGSNLFTLKLDLANVVVTVDPKSLEQGIQDFKVKVYHPKGELEFNNEEISTQKRGYFMMPNGDSPESPKTLNYIISGKNQKGEEVSFEGEIEDVKRAHLYNLVISADESQLENGGALIRLEIQDIPVIEQYYEILPGPSFKAYYGGSLFDLNSQVTGTSNDFSELKVRSLIYDNVSELSLKFNEGFQDMSQFNDQNLVDNSELKSSLEQKGINVELKEFTDRSSIEDGKDVKVIEAWITFTSKFLNGLEEKSNPYEIVITSKDNRNYKNSVTVNIANNEAAIENPAPVVSSPAPDINKEPMAILAHSATLTGMIMSDDAQNYGIKYREQGQGEFIAVKADGTRSSSDTYTVTLTNLNPGTTYEYKAYCDDFEEPLSRTFQTESQFEIPYGDMETWSTHSDKSAMVSPDGTVKFWDSGNHGSMLLAVIGGGVNLTQADQTFIPGTTVAKLQSQAVVGVMAAGNLFAGEYGGNVSTKGARLTFGQPYDNSHPSALKVKVNYRPGNVDKLKSGTIATEYLTSGGLDQAQIFIALATEKSSLNTAEGNMFDPTGDNIIAYGEHTFYDKFANDNELETLTVPLKYYDNAKTALPTHIIIVCSASKFGDYFSGSTKSVMYVDDFELEYGEIQFEN